MKANDYRDAVNQRLHNEGYRGLTNVSEINLLVNNFNAGLSEGETADMIIGLRLHLARMLSSRPHAEDFAIPAPIEPVAAVTATARWHLRCARDGEQEPYLKEGWEPFAVDRDCDVWFRKWTAD